MTFINKNVEKGLQEAADEKQKEEMDLIRQERKRQGLNPEIGEEKSGFVMIGGGFGFFQIISSKI